MKKKKKEERPRNSRVFKPPLELKNSQSGEKLVSLGPLSFSLEALMKQ
jgi:hypothetical protein